MGYIHRGTFVCVYASETSDGAGRDLAILYLGRRHLGRLGKSTAHLAIRQHLEAYAESQIINRGIVALSMLMLTRTFIASGGLKATLILACLLPVA